MLPLLLGVWLGGLHGAVPGTTPATEITAWLLTANPGDAIVAGATMGAGEMARTTGLLGRRFVLHTVPVSGAGSAIDRIAAANRRGTTMFLLLDLDDKSACEVARRFASAPAVVVMNARVVSKPCTAPVLLLRMPQARREAVLDETPTRGTALRIDEWHPSLQRFGAQELNERYQRAAHRDMSGDAWAGWFATKVAAEAALRLESVRRQALIGRQAPSFDGHKGMPLRFDESGVLEQPVYVIDSSGGGAGRVLKELS